MTTMQKDSLICFDYIMSRVSLGNEKGMEIGKILRFSFYEPL